MQLQFGVHQILFFYNSAPITGTLSMLTSILQDRIHIAFFLFFIVRYWEKFIHHAYILLGELLSAPAASWGEDQGYRETGEGVKADQG